MEASNVKAIRDALMEASIALSSATHHHLTEDDAKDCLAVIESALSAPPRNCDVGTSEEQEKRYLSLCDANNCSSCPVRFKGVTDCVFTWEQMPYEEGGTE